MRILAICLLAALVLSGCAGSSKDTSTVETDTTGGGTVTSTASNTGTSGAVGGTMAITFTTSSLIVESGAKPLFKVNATFKDSKGEIVNPPGIAWRVNTQQVKNAAGEPVTEKATEAAKGSALPGNFTLTFGTEGVVRVTAYVKANTYTEQNVSLEIKVNPGAPPPGPVFQGEFDDGYTATLPMAYQGEHEAIFDEAIDNPQANGTFLRYYKFTYAEAGSVIDVATATTEVAIVDCDVWMRIPDGSYVGGTNDGDCTEQLSFSAPGPGEYVLVVLNWSGGPGKIKTSILAK